MRFRTTVAAATLLLLFTGCGDSSDGAGETGATTVATTTAGQTLTPAVDPPTTGNDAPDDAEMSPENCPQLVAAIGSAANVAAAGLTGNPTAELPAANMRALADRIPEISADLTIIADAYEAFFRRLEELGVDLMDPTTFVGLDPASMEEMSAAAEALDEGPVAQANENIQSFFERECS